MFRYFSKIALRYLWQHKNYTILNYVCLSFGFTCAIAALLYINHLFSFDKFHTHYKRLYTVEAMVTYFNGDRFPKQYLSASLPDELKKSAPQIENITRIIQRTYPFTFGEKTLQADAIYADPNFFNVFTFPVLAGSSSTLLGNPNQVAISSNMAMKLFGNADCIGKTITMNAEGKQVPFQISGIFSRVPAHSTLQFDFVIPFERFLSDNKWATETAAASNETWILLREHTDPAAVTAQIKNLIKNQEGNLNQELFLFPLSDKALYSYDKNGKTWRAMQYVVIVGAVGLVILLIACFNFINLAIAMNIRRFRETGIKRVVGSRKSLIFYQFLGETFMIIIAGLITATFLINLLLPFLNNMLRTDMDFGLLNLKTAAILISIALFTGIVAGILPALYLASSNPLSVLKGKAPSNTGYSVFRQGLIVFQFTIPVALIICMMIIRSQDSYMRRYDVGIDKNRLMIVDMDESIMKHAENIKSDLLKLSDVEAVSITNCIPTRGARVSNDVSWEGKDPGEQVHFWCIHTDFDYNKTVEIQMTEGRFFDPKYPSDSTCYVINDIAAKVMKLNNPVGAKITYEGNQGQVIGMFKNFHAVDLSGPYTPVIIRMKPDQGQIMLVKSSSGSVASIMNPLKKICDPYAPEESFHASLFSDLVPYRNLSLPSASIGIAFIIALALACMGLFGLASFNSERRTKEIGIRKTNGATTYTIMLMMLSNYLKWLLISILIALPVAFVLGNIFLSSFYFHTSFPWWALIAGPAIAGTVALITVSSLTWKVATRNPVEALRYE